MECCRKFGSDVYDISHPLHLSPPAVIGSYGRMHAACVFAFGKSSIYLKNVYSYLKMEQAGHTSSTISDL
jgi:hypothetical protein